MTELFLARHGETEENVAQILQGHLPGHLTAKGQAQAGELARTLAKEAADFDIILVSDLQRTVDTARIINSELHLPVMPCRLLRERDWGSFTGVSIAQAHNEPIPNDAETMEQMFERAATFLRHVCQHYEGKRVLAVGHGLFNRTIQAAYQGCTIRDIPRMANAEVRRIVIEKLPEKLLREGGDVISAD